jgi:transcriptional regulator with XRE-family HTH domain
LLNSNQHRTRTVGASLAANLRRRRDAAGLSLVELAELAGTAKGTVSAIEAGKANPTVETVYAVAAALGCTMADLLADTPDPMIVEIRGPARSERIGEFDGRLLQRFAPTGPVEIYEISVNDRKLRRSRPHAHGVYEHIWVADGRVQLGPVDQIVELDAGDYVCFPGWHDHQYRVLVRPARLLMLLSYTRTVPEVPVLRHLA